MIMGAGKYFLKDSSFRFALTIIKHYKYLIETKHEYILSNQLLKSGTAIGAMIREAQNAESTNDFIHKLAVAQKECDETMYWLELLNESGYLDLNEFATTHESASSLLKMVRSAILTTKQRNDK